MGSLANSSSLQTTIRDETVALPLSAFSQPSLPTLKPSPRLRLMPTMATTTAMDWPTTDTGMDWLTMATTAPMLTPTPTDTTTARGPLMLSQRLMLTTATTTVMLLTVMPTVDTTAILMPTMATTATITESNL